MMKRLILFLLMACGGSLVAQPPAPVSAPQPRATIDAAPGCGGLDLRLVRADEPKAPVDPDAKNFKYARGRLSPTEETVDKRHAAAFRRHDHRIKHLAVAAAATFDCRTMGWVGPVLDQGNCGSCWDVSGVDCITSAYVKAGYAKPDGSFNISAQFLLDQCGYKNWGCDGDDAINVLDWAKTRGIPSEADYGPYTARQGTCKFRQGTKLYTLTDWGYCTPAQQSGMASTQDIKNCLTQYGPISSAVAADSSWDSATPSGVIPYRKSSPSAINHDIQIVGWNDDMQITGSPVKGAWIIKNQWSKAWGDKGYGYLAYGSHQIGTEAAFATVAPLPPPPGPNPPEPPSPPPSPPTPPAPGMGYTGLLSKVQEYKDGVPVGPERLVLGPPPTGGSVEEKLQAGGVSPVVIADVMVLLGDLVARPKDPAALPAWRQKVMADVLKLVADFALAP